MVGQHLLEAVEAKKSGFDINKIRNIKLEGSEKQVKWAKDIRDHAIEIYKKYVNIDPTTLKTFKEKDGYMRWRRLAFNFMNPNPRYSVKDKFAYNMGFRTAEQYLRDRRDLNSKEKILQKITKDRNNSLSYVKVLKSYKDDVPKYSSRVNKYYDNVLKDINRFIPNDKKSTLNLVHERKKANETIQKAAHKLDRYYIEENMKNNSASWWIDHR